MIVYLESSAALAWLLGEPSQATVLKHLQGADRVVTSSLTALECARGLTRARTLGRLSATDELALRHLLGVTESTWDVHDLSERVLQRARGTFPEEPVRSLDALHIATALVFHEALGPITVLSYDQRVRQNCVRLGMAVVPKAIRP